MKDQGSWRDELLRCNQNFAVWALRSSDIDQTGTVVSTTLRNIYPISSATKWVATYVGKVTLGHGYLRNFRRNLITLIS